MDMGALYNWLTDQAEAKLRESDIISAISGPDDSIAAWRMLRAQSGAFYKAAGEIRAELKRTDPRGDWRRWEDKQYWSN